MVVTGEGILCLIDRGVDKSKLVNLLRANFLELNTDRGVNVWENSLGSNYGVGS